MAEHFPALREAPRTLGVTASERIHHPLAKLKDL
jgi:hypothetical protein